MNGNGQWPCDGEWNGSLRHVEAKLGRNNLNKISLRNRDSIRQVEDMTCRIFALHRKKNSLGDVTCID